MSWHRFVEAMKHSLALSGRRRAHATLQSMGNRQLRDMGFDPELVAQGVHAWPWRDVESSLGERTDASTTLRAAEKELNAYKDSELNELGIGRTEVASAVRLGRPGIDKAAA